MITLGAAVLCDAASVREGLLHVLGGGITLLSRTDFPAPIASDLALTLYVTDAKMERQTHTVAVKGFQEGASEEMFGFELDLSLDPTSATVPGAVQSVPLVVPTSMMGVPEPGSYRIEVSVDGELLTSVLFTAVLQPEG